MRIFMCFDMKKFTGFDEKKGWCFDENKRVFFLWEYLCVLISSNICFDTKKFASFDKKKMCVLTGSNYI
jgi:hypothetical protein